MTWVEPPTDFDPHTLAEFIECESIVSPDEYLSLSELRGLFPVGAQPNDDDLTFAFAEIERRGRDFGTHYPFLVDDRGVLMVESESSALYSLLVILSVRGTQVRREGEYRRSDPLFDAVAREAFRAEQGSRAKALIFAWPPRGDRPAKFPEALKWAANAMGIDVRDPEKLPTNYQDAGVDVIVWRPFTDGRTGFTILLAQNTVQEVFRKKPRDVSASKWHGWLRVGVLPSIGFAIPFSLPRGDIWWTEVTDEVAVAMDRGRLMDSLQGEDPTAWAEWVAIVDFVQDQIDYLRAAEGSDVPAASIPKRRKKTIFPG